MRFNRSRSDLEVGGNFLGRQATRDQRQHFALAVGQPLQALALTVAFVGETVAKEKTGSAMGLLGTMSAIGTALGPSLGGALIASAGWRAIFLIMVPLGIVTLLLAHRALPIGRQKAKTDRDGFDGLGTLLLALTLGTYALAMTIGRGSFGPLNVALVSVAAVVFLPPTLIASIYGMNFDFMPELDWLWGYPFAGVLMILSAILPYWYFRRRGWL